MSHDDDTFCDLMGVQPGNWVSDEMSSQNIFTSYFITETTIRGLALVSRQSIHIEVLTNFR